MRRVVLDPSALLTWFSPESGGALRAEYEDGLLNVVAPPQLILGILETLASSGESADRLVQIARELERLGFELREPPVDETAAWLARGLPAHKAAYAALASGLDLPLVTADPDLLRIARAVAQPPAGA